MKVNVNNRTGCSCHSLQVGLLCSLYLHTGNPSLAGLLTLFQSEYASFKCWACIADDTLLSFLCAQSQFLANKAGLCEHVFSLYPQLLPVTLCYITPFNLADGYFPAHHPSSPLPFLSPLSPALLCTPPVSHLCPVPPHVSLHSFTPTLASLLSPAYCVNVNFTLLMFITSITVCVLSGCRVYLYC